MALQGLQNTSVQTRRMSDGGSSNGMTPTKGTPTEEISMFPQLDYTEMGQKLGAAADKLEQALKVQDRYAASRSYKELKDLIQQYRTAIEKKEADRDIKNSTLTALNADEKEVDSKFKEFEEKTQHKPPQIRYHYVGLVPNGLRKLLGA